MRDLGISSSVPQPTTMNLHSARLILLLLPLASGSRSPNAFTLSIAAFNSSHSGPPPRNLAVSVLRELQRPLAVLTEQPQPQPFALTANERVLMLADTGQLAFVTPTGQVAFSIVRQRSALVAAVDLACEESTERSALALRPADVRMGPSPTPPPPGWELPELMRCEQRSVPSETKATGMDCLSRRRSRRAMVGLATWLRGRVADARMC